MVLILDGNLKIIVDVYREIGNLICLKQLFRSTVVRVERVLSYHLVYAMHHGGIKSNLTLKVLYVK